MHGKKREASEWSLQSPGGLSVLASAVGGLLTRMLVCSQVECVTENSPVYSFHMLMRLRVTSMWKNFFLEFKLEFVFLIKGWFRGAFILFFFTLMKRAICFAVHIKGGVYIFKRIIFAFLGVKKKSHKSQVFWLFLVGRIDIFYVKCRFWNDSLDVNMQEDVASKQRAWNQISVMTNKTRTVVLRKCTPLWTKSEQKGCRDETHRLQWSDSLFTCFPPQHVKGCRL